MNTNTDPNDPTVQIIENATEDDIHPGDHVIWSTTWESRGLTSTRLREGIAHRRDGFGNWRTVGGACLTDGSGEGITITVRRATPAEGATK